MEFKHFSHEHNLSLYQAQPGQQLICSGCEKPCSSSMYYACWGCNFFLHEHCGNANRFVKHPSHPQHPLILIPTPTYCSGTFSCNGCGETSKTFSYGCALCEVDLHVHCAFLPPKVTQISHPHDLSLSYSNQQKGESCNNCQICNRPLLSKHWDYSCPKCDFHVHTFCATSEVKPGLYLDDHDDSHTASEAQPGNQQSQHHQNTAEDQRSDDVAAELLNLQLQMQMSQQLAAMMASFNPASFIG